MSTHTEFELKRAGLIEGATITPEVIAAVAKVMISRDEQAQQFAEMAMERQETLDAVYLAAMTRKGLDGQDVPPIGEYFGIVQIVGCLKHLVDVYDWMTDDAAQPSDSDPIRPSAEDRETMAAVFVHDFVAFVEVAESQMMARIDELIAIPAEMDNPGYPQAG